MILYRISGAQKKNHVIASQRKLARNDVVLFIISNFKFIFIMYSLLTLLC